MSAPLTHRDCQIEVLDGPYTVGGKPTPEAVAYFTDLAERIDDLRAFAAVKLLRLYNDEWLTPEIGVLDAAGFMRRLTRPSITIYDEIGAALVHFEDSEMFAGHYVEVSIRNGVPTSADLAG